MLAKIVNRVRLGVRALTTPSANVPTKKKAPYTAEDLLRVINLSFQKA